MITLSVVTYNSSKDIEKMLESFLSFSDNLDYRMYVIDNHSSDDTVDIINHYVNDKIELISLGQNIGFGAAHNKILERIDSQYHIYVNPDIVFDNYVVTSMVEYMNQHKEIGLLSPKVVGLDGTLQVLPKRDPKLIYLVSRRVNNLKLLQNYRKEYEMGELDPNSVFDIEFATGCFMFVRTDLLKKVGGFDERFFLYFEDADLSREIRRYAKVEYNPHFVVRHRWERGGAKNFKLMIIQIKSMLEYRKKWKTRDRNFS